MRGVAALMVLQFVAGCDDSSDGIPHGLDAGVACTMLRTAIAEAAGRPAEVINDSNKYVGAMWSSCS